jgi:hypothetical protein
MESHQHSHEVVTFCVWHSLNIAVKRAIMEPAGPFSEVDRGDLTQSVDHSDKSKFWFYTDEEEDKITPEALPAQRSRVHSTHIASYLQHLFEIGATKDASDENLDNDEATLQSMLPDVAGDVGDGIVDIRVQIVRLVDRCRQVVKYLKSIRVPPRHVANFNLSSEIEVIWDNSGDGATLLDECQRLEILSKFLLEFGLITKNCEGDDVLAPDALVAAATFKKLLEERNQLSEDEITELLTLCQ